LLNHAARGQFHHPAVVFRKGGDIANIVGYHQGWLVSHVMGKGRSYSGTRPKID
jgi:hypothetical protein